MAAQLHFGPFRSKREMHIDLFTSNEKRLDVPYICTFTAVAVVVAVNECCLTFPLVMQLCGL